MWDSHSGGPVPLAHLSLNSVCRVLLSLGWLGEDMPVVPQEQSRVHQEPRQLVIVCVGLAEEGTIPGVLQQAEGSGCYPVLDASALDCCMQSVPSSLSPHTSCVLGFTGSSTFPSQLAGTTTHMWKSQESGRSG